MNIQATYFLFKFWPMCVFFYEFSIMYFIFYEFWLNMSSWTMAENAFEIHKCVKTLTYL